MQINSDGGSIYILWCNGIEAWNQIKPIDTYDRSVHEMSQTHMWHCPLLYIVTVCTRIVVGHIADAMMKLAS